ncbi:MAG TPA: DUF4384 domain-containing protein [Pyrinomonadaceae bacterium]|jgi:hypothetical protein|nr:DUF4384 domain-containing protein [Pyrinomonadaceae bacterium]
MRIKIFVPLLALALMTCASASVRAQDEEEAVRGSFLTTRVTASSGSGNTTSAAISASANSAAAKTGGSAKTGNTGKTSKTKKSTGKASAGVSVSTKGSTVKAGGTVKADSSMNSYLPTALGLGYTLYKRDSMGNAVRVDPSQEFHAGDRIRLSLETNTDGYLYIFHTENDGEPEMLYPDVRLGKGNNQIEAHVPYEIPWNEPGVENWFKFDANPANERLYVVVTRQPLPGVPVGSALVDYCGQNRCPWQPPVGVWAQVKLNGQAKVGVVRSARYGQKQSTLEREATTRGLGLDQAAPEPSIIRMNVSSNAPILVTAVELVHK